MPTDINPDALPELKSLATWLSRSAQMREEKGKKNLLECVDENREAKAWPLLEKLGYATIRVKDQFALKNLIRKCC